MDEADAVWNVRYVVPGEPKIISSRHNPQTLSSARDEARKVRDLTREWRLWIEHTETGKRAYESLAEKAYQLDKALWSPPIQSRFVWHGLRG